MRALALAIVLLWAGAAHAVEYWVNCETGSNSNSCTSKGAACATYEGAMAKASCGDTITHVSGTTCYPTSSTGFTVSGKSCTAGNPFEIRCEVEPDPPAASTCVMSGLGEWSDSAGNTGVDYAQLGTDTTLWDVYDSSKKIYRTKAAGFANGATMWMFFRNDSYNVGEITSGIQYNDNCWILTPGKSASDTDGNAVPEDEEHGPNPSERSVWCRYEGPGTWVEGGRLYVRMKRLWLHGYQWNDWHYANDMVPGKNSLATDGAQVFLFREASRGLVFSSSADYVTWNGIDVLHYGRTLITQAGANNNTIKNVNHGVSGRYPGYIEGDFSTLDNVACDRHLPITFGREAVKKSPAGAGRLSTHQGDCWHSDRRTNGVTIKNSYCVDSFDCLVHSGGADNHLYENNLMIRMRDDTQQNKYLGSFTLKDNTCYGCYGFFGPYTSYGTNGPHYMYGNWVDTTFLFQVGGPLDGLPLRFSNTCPSCGGRASSAINPRGAAVADDGRLSGRFCQTHGGSSTTLKSYNNTILHRGDWYGRATGCGVSDMLGNNESDRKTEYINTIWQGTGNGTALLDDARACRQFYDYNIYWRGSGVSETSQSCSSVSCLFDGHPGGGMTWERWCGAGTAGGICGPWASTADGNAGRNTNCSGSPSGFDGDWDVNSYNHDPQLNPITNFDHLSWETAACYVGEDDCPDGRPVEGGNAATGGAAIPAIWPDNTRYTANGFIGALSPGSGTPTPPPDTWECPDLVITPTSCTAGVDCAALQFEIDAQCVGTTGNWDFEIDCKRDLNYEAESPNPLSSCTGSGTVADCETAPSKVCDYSGVAAGTYQVEVRSNNTTTGLTGSKLTPFTVYDDTPTQDVFPNFTSSKGDTASNCQANDALASINDANNLPGNELTDGWYNDTCTDSHPSPQTNCCMQGDWTSGASCNTGDNRLDLRGAVAPAEVPKGDQDVLLRVRSCDAVGKTVRLGFWDTTGNDWYCFQDFPGIGQAWTTLTFTRAWDQCGTMHTDHPDGGGISVAYQCFGCDATSLAWRAAVEDPGPGNPPPPDPPTLVPGRSMDATSAGSLNQQ